MKYILFTALLLLVSLNAQSNKKYWDNRQVQMDISVKDSKPNGTAKFYHDNGKQYSIVEYKNGKICSNEVKLFAKDGKLLFTNHYKNSHPYGEYKTYLFQNNMEILFDGSYKDKKFTGVEKRYYGDATLRSITHFKNGKKNGLEEQYDYKGKINVQIPYKNGKKNGVQKEYTTNGKNEITYKNDTLDGLSKLYYKNGKMESSTNYKNGKKSGISSKYNNDGTLAWKGTFKNDKLIK